MALDAVTVAAGITTVRPTFWITKKTMRERASAGCERPSGRAIWARSAAQNTKRTLLFSASRTARAKQHASPQRSGAQFEQGYACLRPVRAVGCSIRACSDGCSTKGRRIVRLSILSVVIAFSQYFIIINVCSLCQHTICATGTARAPMARC